MDDDAVDDDGFVAIGGDKDLRLVAAIDQRAAHAREVVAEAAAVSIFRDVLGGHERYSSARRLGRTGSTLNHSELGSDDCNEDSAEYCTLANHKTVIWIRARVRAFVPIISIDPFPRCCSPAPAASLVSP